MTLPTHIATLEGCIWRQDPNTLRVWGRGDADIDADGSPRAYHPDDTPGLDALANAGRTGKWWGIAWHPFGHPYIQEACDPAPGYYVSTTAYERMQYTKWNPSRYVDSEVVPFMVVPGYVRERAKGIVLGCRGIITDTRTGRSCEAGVLDVGPMYKAGEMSIAAARLLWIPSDPRHGGISEKCFLYEFWPGQPFEFGGEKFDLIPAR